MRGAPLGGRICLAGMPWRTRIPTPLAGASQMPLPRDSKGAPQKGCQPEAPVCARITRCATAVRLISEISTTSVRQSATVCQCKCKDVTFAIATRMGPGWGFMSPHRNTRRGGKPQHLGGVVPPREPQSRGGERGNPHPPHKLVRRWSWGARREVRGAARHACRLTVDPSPAAPWSDSRARSPSKGGRRRGRRRRERRSAMGARQGRRRCTLRAAPFPVAREAEGLLEGHVHAVLDWPWPSAAEGIGPQGRGVDLPRLRQDGPPHVGDHREEGVYGIGHLPPRRPRTGVWGRLAGGVVVPDPAPPVHPHGVVPAGGRCPLEEGEAAARAEEPAWRGAVPLLHTAGPGLPP